MRREESRKVENEPAIILSRGALLHLDYLRHPFWTPQLLLQFALDELRSLFLRYWHAGEFVAGGGGGSLLVRCS